MDAVSVTQAASVACMHEPLEFACAFMRIREGSCFVAVIPKVLLEFAACKNCSPELHVTVRVQGKKYASRHLLKSSFAPHKPSLMSIISVNYLLFF